MYRQLNHCEQTYRCRLSIVGWVVFLFIVISIPTYAADSNVITFEYDLNDNLIRTTDKRGIVTESDYDKINRLIEQRRNDILVIKNEYNDVSDLVAVTDANGNTTAMEYNG